MSLAEERSLGQPNWRPSEWEGIHPARKGIMHALLNESARNKKTDGSRGSFTDAVHGWTVRAIHDVPRAVHWPEIARLARGPPHAHDGGEEEREAAKRTERAKEQQAAAAAAAARRLKMTLKMAYLGSSLLKVTEWKPPSCSDSDEEQLSAQEVEAAVARGVKFIPTLWQPSSM